eukprot:TRINITY_DN777895_c0_g1_i1.p1 TRINITY_DN777895_c0_g1~~TRINITY_DN777895_c0_g1_i1.p1  ORF type:complete len:476 (-),score=152.40 TRINITY_DN777895_c0_g1_i1:335-1762(-)
MQAYLKDLGEVGNAVKESSEGLRSVGVKTVTMSSIYLASEKKKNLTENPALVFNQFRGCASPSVDQLRTVLQRGVFAEWVYNDDKKTTCMEKLKGVGYECVVHNEKSEKDKPAHMIVVKRDVKDVILAVRGTLSFHDVMTDLNGVQVKWGSGTAHRGMVRGALYLYTLVKDSLIQFARDGFRISIVGHSLGAAVAALLTSVLRRHIPSLHCFCYAPPCAVSENLARSFAEFTTSVIYGYDAVPRASTHTIDALGEELMTYDWSAVMKEDVRGKVDPILAKAFGTNMAEMDKAIANAKANMESTGKMIGTKLSELDDKIGYTKNAAILEEKAKAKLKEANAKMSKWKVMKSAKNFMSRKKKEPEVKKPVIEEPSFWKDLYKTLDFPFAEELAISGMAGNKLVPPGCLIVMFRTDLNHSVGSVLKEHGKHVPQKCYAVFIDQTHPFMNELMCLPQALSHHMMEEYTGALRDICNPTV